jgi:uncharacterized membrane protein YkvA (DUF1232 family)
MLQTWKQRARALKRETFALYLALRDPRVPWYARLLGICIIGYALSPIDLIPDFIPVLGYLDDVILVPLGIALLLKMIPDPVMIECRERAQALVAEGRPVNRTAAALIIATWILSAALLVAFVVQRFSD